MPPCLRAHYERKKTVLLTRHSRWHVPLLVRFHSVSHVGFQSMSDTIVISHLAVVSRAVRGVSTGNMASSLSLSLSLVFFLSRSLSLALSLSFSLSSSLSLSLSFSLSLIT